MFSFFTTTYRDIFKRDLINTCCYQQGQVVRFSYRNDHITSDARKRLQRWDKCGQSLIRQNVDRKSIIVFCEYVHDWGEYRYHPIRIAEVFRVIKPSDESFLIDLKLGGWFEYPSANTTLPRRKLFENLFVKNINRKLEYPETRGKSQSQEKYVVFHEKDSKRTKIMSRCFNAYFGNHWHEMAKYVGKLSGMRDVIYVHIDSFKRLPGNRIDISIVGRGRDITPKTSFSYHDGEINSYTVLYRGKRYNIKLSVYDARETHNSENRKDFDIPLNVSLEPAGEAIGPDSWQGREGTTSFSYSIFVRRQQIVEHSSFRLETPDDTWSPTLNAPVQFSPTAISRYSIFGAILIGVIMLNSGPEFYWYLTDNAITEVVQKTPPWQRSPFPVLLIQACGGALFAWGIYAGFKRLPTSQ